MDGGTNGFSRLLTTVYHNSACCGLCLLWGFLQLCGCVFRWGGCLQQSKGHALYFVPVSENIQCNFSYCGFFSFLLCVCLSAWLCVSCRRSTKAAALVVSNHLRAPSFCLNTTRRDLWPFSSVTTGNGAQSSHCILVRLWRLCGRYHSSTISVLLILARRTHAPLQTNQAEQNILLRGAAEPRRIELDLPTATHYIVTAVLESVSSNKRTMSSEQTINC